jgi:site-specific recombinase XerD
MWPFRTEDRNEINEAVDNWLENASERKATFTSYRRSLRLWIEFNKKVTETTDIRVQSFIKYLTNDKKFAGSTTWETFKTLSSLYSSLMNQGLVRKNPFISHLAKLESKADKGKRPHILIEEDVIKAVLTSLDLDDPLHCRAAIGIALGYGAGLRMNEVLTLRMKDLVVTSEQQGMDTKRVIYAHVRAEISKNKKARDAALPEWIHPYVLTWYERRHAIITDPDALVISQFYGTTAPLSNTSMRVHLGRIFMAFNTPFTMHALRASAITHLKDKGLRGRDIKDWSGHSSESFLDKNYDKRTFGVDQSPWKKAGVNIF